ncbi:MAG: type I restriction endonuclease subunit R [Thermoleophilia bacterium]|nr:type I restriction endonuclease subunit R [Thermoleophilia bacterium]
MTRAYSEDALIEQPAIVLFKELGWGYANCFGEFDGAGGSPLGRETTTDVVLVPRLRAALERLNPGLPPESIIAAIEQLTMDRSAMSLAAANGEIYKLLRDGVQVSVSGGAGGGGGAGESTGGGSAGAAADADAYVAAAAAADEEHIETARIIDWDNPANNDFFLASQFWVTGDMYKRRADLVGFVNGLPLLFIELKASHRRLENAFRYNLRDYKDNIPQLFWYNAFIILSNGSQSRIGSVTSAWEHFNEWKKISDEDEPGVVSLETIIRGTCEPARCLDLAENFILFSDAGGGLIKLVAKNHQYFGVNNAIEAMREAGARQGRLGVFWHTQGSGKSVSMIFFSQKVLRKMPGNYTFLIVTDRRELDGQIYKFFASTGAVTEAEEAHARDGEHLKQLLREDHRYVFTLIQKFRTKKGEAYPMLSERSDIIVITDEAHRSQYDIFALNMRNALPNAAFIGFTGTPLMVGEEKTRRVFGDYVSVYNFRQSVDDGATVPLYYENRIPELQLANEDFSEEMERLLEKAEIDEAEERKLEREFAREYHLITREDRLEKVAEDIVTHYMGRGQRGKSMVVCIDKATAVRMFDKVQRHWREHLAALRGELEDGDFTGREDERAEFGDRLRYLSETDMAVVISQSQNEVADFKAQGLDIVPHRRRMIAEDLDTKFKDADDPFRIVFVCAMWMTGFDVPSCNTIYLDKPMRNHTLMQTIARANRVWGDKENGLIVDYVGVFRDLQRALAIYGSFSGGGVAEGDMPVADKAVLVGRLREAIGAVEAFCREHRVDLDGIESAEGFDRVRLIDDAVEAILVTDESKREFLSLADRVAKLYKAILPDPHANEFSIRRSTIVVIADKIRSLAPVVDVSEVMASVDMLLDKSIEAEGYVIEGERRVDLSGIDFEALKARFDQGRKRTEAERLKADLTFKVNQMARLNKSRMDFLEKLQEMIEEYNSGACNVEEFFRQLVEFAGLLQEEEKRGIAEQLSEEELAIFDLLMKPEIELTEKERKKVKAVAGELLEILKAEKLVLDWRKRQQSRAAVRLAIEEGLDQLPKPFDRRLYEQKCSAVYQHVYDSYFGMGMSIYSTAA